MARAARLAEVAKLAGVSPGLVSRMLNDDSTLKIRDETRDRVTAAIELLRYTPHASARALRSAQTGLLGFALHQVNDPIYAQMVEAAELTAEAEGYSIMLLSAPEPDVPTDAFHRIVRGRRIDGLVIQGGYSQDAVLLQDAQTLPSVLFNADAIPGFRTIRLDDSSAAAMATRHLIELGHRDIIFVGSNGGTSARRYQGYVDEMRAAGFSVQPPLSTEWGAEAARSEIGRYLELGSAPTGIVVVSATTALGVHAGVLSAGLSIPGDVSIVSIHDTWFAPHLTPSLTTVSLPLAQLGQAAVELLVKQIHEPSTGETVMDEPTPVLIPRASTAQPPAAIRTSAPR